MAEAAFARCTSPRAANRKGAGRRRRTCLPLCRQAAQDALGVVQLERCLGEGRDSAGCCACCTGRKCHARAPASASERRDQANEILMICRQPPASSSRKIVAAARGSFSQSVCGAAPLLIENLRNQAARARPPDKASFPGLDPTSSYTCGSTH